MTSAATGREAGMTPKSTALEISAICGFFILLALWGIVWDFTSGLLTSGIDGIMLLFVCAMMAGIFFLIVVVQLTESGILPTPAFLKPAPKPAAAAPASKPASAAAVPAAKPAAAATNAPKPAAPAAGTASPAAAKPASPAAGSPAAVAPAAPAKPPAQAPAAPAKPDGNAPAGTPATTPPVQEK